MSRVKNHLKKIFILILFLPLLSNAKDNSNIGTESVNSVVKYYFTSKAIINKKNTSVSGDFNRDGYTDIAVLIRPATGIKELKNIIVSERWNYAERKAEKRNYTSLAIINGSSKGFRRSDAKVFVLLDHTGVLETPAFQLIAKKVNDKDYSKHTQMLPLKIQKDFIILPTEAGIDTYVYWDKGSYKLYEPEEEP